MWEQAEETAEEAELGHSQGNPKDLEVKGEEGHS